MPRQMVSPHLNEISGVDHPAHLAEGWLLMKSRNGRTTKTMPKLAKEVRQALPEDVQAYIKSLEKVAKAAAPSEDEAEIAAFEKAVELLPAPAREALLKQQRQAAEDRALAKALRDERDAGKYEAMAKSLVHLPKVGAGFATKLQKAAESAGDAFDPIFEVLKAADAALKESGFFKEIGSGHTGSADSAEAVLFAKAADIQKADPNLSYADAVERAAQENPDLVRQQRRESLGRNQSVEV